MDENDRAEGVGPDAGAGGGRAWLQDRRRFVEEDTRLRREGHPEHLVGKAVPVADSTVSPLAREFAALARVLSDPVGESGSVVDVLDRIVRAALGMVDGADVVSVTVRLENGKLTTPVETDDLASRLDDAQYETAEGPCVTATGTAGLGIAYHPDLAASGATSSDAALPEDARGVSWPAWAPRAVELGVRSVLSTGIFPDSDPPRQGTLNCYSTVPHALDHADRDTALLLASFAGVALHHTAARSAAELEVAQLREALSTRDVIGQAKGVLMERRGYDADKAFETLRRASQELNLKLRDVAHTLVHRRSEL